jgi:hypothetical protein
MLAYTTPNVNGKSDILDAVRLQCRPSGLVPEGSVGLGKPPLTSKTICPRGAPDPAKGPHELMAPRVSARP